MTPWHLLEIDKMLDPQLVTVDIMIIANAGTYTTQILSLLYKWN